MEKIWKHDRYGILGLHRGASLVEVSAAYVELSTGTTNPGKLAEIEEAYATIMGTEPIERFHHLAGEMEEADAEGEDWEDTEYEEEDVDDFETDDQDDNACGLESKTKPAKLQPGAVPATRPQSRAELSLDVGPETESFDPYRALNLTKKATPSQIRASYNRLMAMTRRPARRYEIERAFEILSERRSGLAKTESLQISQAEPVRSSTGSRTSFHYREDHDRDEYEYDESPYHIPITRARARRERKWEEKEWRAWQRAQDDVDPNRNY